jgi:bifunctional non-homologous end joining protein LigD
MTRDQGLEGVVLKRVDSRYEPGRRSPAWRKLKHFVSQDFVVGGFEPGAGRRADSIGSLLLGVHDPDGLVFAGAVGSGLTDAMLPILLAALSRIERATSPFVRGSPPRAARFVEPVIVVEVRFANWTSAGVIRAPSYRGIRPDIDPASVVRLPTPT